MPRYLHLAACLASTLARATQWLGQAWPGLAERPSWPKAEKKVSVPSKVGKPSTRRPFEPPVKHALSAPPEPKSSSRSALVLQAPHPASSLQLRPPPKPPCPREVLGTILSPTGYRFHATGLRRGHRLKSPAAVAFDGFLDHHPCPAGKAPSSEMEAPNLPCIAACRPSRTSTLSPLS